MTRRTLRRGEAKLEINTGTTGSSASTAAGIRNYGVTVLPGSPVNEYILDAPVEGVVKTIVCSNAASSLNDSVRVKTSIGISSVGNVSVGVAPGTASVLSMGSSASTAQPSITLVGRNSTHWDIIANTGVTFTS